MRMLALKLAYLTEMSQCRACSGMADIKSRNDNIRTLSFSIYQLYFPWRADFNAT